MAQVHDGKGWPSIIICVILTWSCFWNDAALASISNKAEVDSDAGDDAACSSGRNRGSQEQQEGSEQASPRRDFQRRDSGPPFGREVPPSVRLRRAMSDPIERTGSLSRRRSTRLSDADAATAAAALAGTPLHPIKHCSFVDCP